MAGEDRTAPQAVDQRQALSEKPYAFDFYQVLRLLECLNPDKPRIGCSNRATDDVVRLAQEPSLAFAPSSLASFTPAGGGVPDRLAVYFFGLFGPNGPLPLHLTEYASERRRHYGDRTLIGFADIFHHRMLSLFYRAWADAQPHVNFDRPDSDRFATYLGALFGNALPSMRDRDAVSDLAKLHHAGLLSCQTHHADGLRSFLSSFFEMPVEIESFQGSWIDLPQDSRWRLGESAATGAIGQTTIVGARIWDCQQKFRVVFGPLGLEDCLRLLPNRSAMRRLVAIVRNYCGDELAWDAKVIVKKEEIPRTRLGGEQQLGWTTWLISGPQAEDAEDLVLDPMSILESQSNGPDSSTDVVFDERFVSPQESAHG